MLSKHSSCWWFEPTWCSCDVNVLTYLFTFVVLTALFKFPPMWKLVHTGPIISIFESNHRHYNWNLSPWRCSTHKIISMIKMGLNNHTLECCLTRAAWEAACLTWQPVLHHYYSIKWKHFPRYWPFVRGIHGSSVDSRHKGPVTRIFDDLFNVSLKKGVKNNGMAVDLRRRDAHRDVTVVWWSRSVGSRAMIFCHYRNNGIIGQAIVFTGNANYHSIILGMWNV